jgi:hypothetical protein
VGDVTEVVVRELEQLVDEEEMAVVGVGDVALVSFVGVGFLCGVASPIFSNAL